MRTIRRTGQFKRDYKRESKGRYRKTLDRDLQSVVALLVSDSPLAPRLRDHPLAGEWKNFRDCHIHPDLVMISPKA